MFLFSSRSISCEGSIKIFGGRSRVLAGSSKFRVKFEAFYGMLSFWVLCLFCLANAFRAAGHVVLIGRNSTLSFEDIEANFGPSVEGSGISGKLYVADPLNACSRLSNLVVSEKNHTRHPFLLIIRGGCSFEDKVRRAQAAGFKAAIIYDSEYGDLVVMAGNSTGIKINAVFVTKASGEKLAKYGVVADTELWIVPNFENSAWSIMAMSFISLLAMSAVLATCFFVRRHRIRREWPQTPQVRQFHGMGKHLVKAMPMLTFTSVLEDNCTARTCAICLEDYNVGDKIRILPCCHKFHCLCVDAWLTSWRTFCPVCKRDARTTTGEPPATESTPLLSSSVSSHSLLSSASSPAIYIDPLSYRSTTASRSQSISSTPYYQHSLQSHCQSPPTSTSAHSGDLRSMPSQSAYFVSPPSYRHPSVNSRYTSQYSPSLGNGSSSLVGSSSCRVNPLHYSESVASLSAFDSAQSLPECL